MRCEANDNLSFKRIVEDLMDMVSTMLHMERREYCCKLQDDPKKIARMLRTIKKTVYRKRKAKTKEK